MDIIDCFLPIDAKQLKEINKQFAKQKWTDKLEAFESDGKLAIEVKVEYLPSDIYLQVGMLMGQIWAIEHMDSQLSSKGIKIRKPY